MDIKGNLVDVHSKSVYPAIVRIENGKIANIIKVNESFDQYILPGFVDSHIHIESSLLVPRNFAKLALSFGTVATVSDPHEIANVCGSKGVDFMIGNGKGSGVKFFWTAPSCVPATDFETSGASMDAEALKGVLLRPEVVALGEMMNYPGVIYSEPGVIEKIQVAKRVGKVVDGHAPALKGKELKKYIASGISTDHECATLEEAKEKLELGMKILIREGSSAKNFTALYSLINSNPDDVMLCSDDLHADDLMEGHLNILVKRALSLDISLFNVLKTVSVNPVSHYSLPVGLLRVGDAADFIIVDNLKDFSVKETWIDGVLVFKKGYNSDKFEDRSETINQFNSEFVGIEDLKIDVKGRKANVIEVEEGQLLTKRNTFIIPDGFEDFLQRKDILKLYVKDRYHNLHLGKALVRGFGPVKGAIASTIAHDSHNIIAVGDNYADIVEAINLLVQSKGGIVFVNTSNNIREFLPLPVAGLMSDRPAAQVAHQYKEIISAAHKFGCTLKSPLMTLSFLALLVIPSLKLSDKGLFDVDSFSFTNLFYQ